MSPPAPIHVLCTRAFTPPLLARLQAVSPRLVLTQRPVARRSELADVLSPETEILYGTFAPESLERLPRLRWFQARSAGMNAVASSPLWTAPGITLTSGSGVHGPAIAEYVTGMLIALARDFTGFLACQRASRWPLAPQVNYERFPGRELRGDTVLIVGYGSIGREIGRQCQALGLRVLAVKRDPSVRADRGFTLPGTGDPAGIIPERLGGPGQLAELLPEAGYVVIASAATAANRHLLDAAALRRLRPDAFLVNIARGGG